MPRKKLSTMADVTMWLRAAVVILILLVTVFQKPVSRLYTTDTNLPFAFPVIPFVFAVFNLIGAIILRAICKKEKPFVPALILAIIFVFINSASSYASSIVNNIFAANKDMYYIAANSIICSAIDFVTSPLSTTSFAMFFMTAGICVMSKKPAKILSIIDTALYGLSLLATIIITLLQKSLPGYNEDFSFVIPYTALIIAAFFIIVAAGLITTASVQDQKKNAGILSGITAIFNICLPFLILIETILAGRLGSEVYLAGCVILNGSLALYNPVPIVALPLFYFTAGVYFSDNLEK